MDNYKTSKKKNDKKDSSSNVIACELGDEETTPPTWIPPVTEPNPRKFAKYKTKGNEAFAAGKFRDAVTHYTFALDYSPEDQKHVCFSNRAAAYTAQGFPQLGVDDALACISLKPDWGKAYYRLGTCYFQMNQVFDAFSVFRKGLAVDPGNQMLRKRVKELKEFDRSIPTSLDNDPLAEKWLSLFRGDYQINKGMNCLRVLEDTVYLQFFRRLIRFAINVVKCKKPPFVDGANDENSGVSESMSDSDEDATNESDYEDEDDYQVHILHLGASAGLLPMIAMNEGASHVTSAAPLQFVTACAQEVVEENGFNSDSICFANKAPDRILLGRDTGNMPRRADVIFFDSLIDHDFFSGGIIPALNYAREELLTKDYIPVPAQAVIEGCLVEIRTGSVCGINMSNFDRYRWSASYEPIEVASSNNLTYLSSPFNLFHLKFAPESILNPESKSIQVNISQSGTANAVIVWFKLLGMHKENDEMDENETNDDWISTSPFVIPDRRPSSWRQALTYLPDLPVTSEQKITLNVSFRNNGLKFDIPDLKQGREISDKEELRFARARRPAVPRQMFAELRDQTLGSYKIALEQAISRIQLPQHNIAVVGEETNRACVLELGVGNGIDVAFAAEAGAEKVFVTEEIHHLCDYCKDLVESHGWDKKVTIFRTSSLDLKPENLECSPNIVVTRNFDCGLLGRGALLEIYHAHARLVGERNIENCQTIPKAADLYASVIELPNYKKVEGFDCSKFTVLRRANGYVPTNLSKIQGMNHLTSPFHCFHFDFQNTIIKHPSNGSKDFQLEIEKDGNLCALVFWYRLQLGDDVFLDFGPDSEHFEQALFYVETPFFVRKGMTLPLVCKYNMFGITFEILHHESLPSRPLSGYGTETPPSWWLEWRSFMENADQYKEENLKSVSAFDLRVISNIASRCSSYWLDCEMAWNMLIDISYRYGRFLANYKDLL